MRPIQFYEMQARDLIKQLRETKGLTYEELAQRLKARGELIETRALINKINRSKFTFAFALQVFAAMEVQDLELPKPWSADDAASARTVGWVSERAPKTTVNQKARSSLKRSG